MRCQCVANVLLMCCSCVATGGYQSGDRSVEEEHQECKWHGLSPGAQGVANVLLGVANVLRMCCGWSFARSSMR